jgi:hypothetical protein
MFPNLIHPEASIPGLPHVTYVPVEEVVNGSRVLTHVNQRRVNLNGEHIKTSVTRDFYDRTSAGDVEHNKEKNNHEDPKQTAPMSFIFYVMFPHVIHVSDYMRPSRATHHVSQMILQIRVDPCRQVRLGLRG